MSENKLHAIDNIRSAGSAGFHDIRDHEVDLRAITSVNIALEDVGSELTSRQKDLVLKRINLEGLVSYDDLPIIATFMLEKVEKLSLNDSIKIIEDALVDFEGDVNIPEETFQLWESLVAKSKGNLFERSSESPQTEKLGEKSSLSQLDVKEGLQDSSSDFSETEGPYSAYKIVDWELQARLEGALIAYHSPYPEVRSVTDPYDDPTTPVETVRVYLLGLIWTCISAFINQYFEDRMPSITLSSSVIQMLLYPCGRILEKVTPKWKFKVWKYTIDLNPGPWNFKEQMLCSLMFGCGGGGVYATANIKVQKIFYKETWVTYGFQILLTLSSTFIGFGFAGIMRKFVVYPVRSMWPTMLPTLALNRALLKPEKKENINGWTISKYKFFFAVSGFSFLYFWIPNYLFTAISTFNWMTWIKPDNFNLAVVTGSVMGLGLNPIATFDWNIFGGGVGTSGALAAPIYTSINGYIGAFISFFIIIGMYYSNYLWTGYLPINTPSLYTNEGERYVATSILNKQGLFDKEKYDEYGPPFYTAGSLMAYGATFALYPFIFFNEVFLNYKAYWKRLKGLGYSFRTLSRSNYEDFDDPHSTMMRKYDEVPDLVFIGVLIISIVLAILTVKLYPVQTPVWTIFFALGINFVFLIPICTLASVTGFSFALNVIVELIIGYALPGNGLAMMTVKCYGAMIDSQAENYITDQKLGHYAKLPPRAMFRVQMLGSLVGAFVSLATQDFKFNHIDRYCMPHQVDKFTCPGTIQYYTASIIWGIIGPKKVFRGLYPILQYTFLIGFLLSIPCALFSKYGPRKWTRYFQPSLIINGMGLWAPYNLSYYNGSLFLSIAFMWYIKKKFTTWWIKYNYVLGSAMSAGVAFSSIIIFFSVQYHAKNINWWGNTVSYAGVDGGNGQPSLLNATTAHGGYFGPRKGHFP